MDRDRRRRSRAFRWLGPAVVGTLATAVLLLGGVAPARAVVINEFSFPSEYGVSPVDIVAGPDGSLWFTLTNAPYGSIGRITTGGVFTEFPIPTVLSNPRYITVGPDGALWFTEAGGNRIGRITTAGVITEFPTTGRGPLRITAGPDGALWFTASDVESNIGRIGRITTAGVITEFRTPTFGSWPLGIVAGPDGALWFTEFNGEQIGRLRAAGSIFADVPADHPFATWIEALVTAGITTGCSTSPPQYCPDGTVTRGQMAVFLLRAKHDAGYSPPAAKGTMFTDVPASQPFAPWIEALVAEGMASGCSSSPPQYCPDAAVTRAQMAVFLLRAKHGAGYSPSAATGTMFTDVPASQPLAKWIEQLAREGITGGCGATSYCPDATVTRAAMAVFLVRTFNLPM